MHTVSLLRPYFVGEVQIGVVPHFAQARGGNFSGIVIPPHTLNVVAWKKATHAPYESSAAIYSGERLVASAGFIDSNGFPQQVISGYDAALMQEEEEGKLLDVEEELAALGYGASKMCVESFLSRDGNYDAQIGGMKVGQDRQFSPFIGIEALAQLLAISLMKKGEIRPGSKLLFASVDDVYVNRGINAPSTLRLLLKDIERSGSKFKANGEIKLNHDTVMKATISGRAVRKETFENMIEERSKQQQTEQPIFPKQ